tara:strand:+ start:214 stop:468 length:255 start_codon:yes stop_codon:yes gene_type:complete
MEDLNTYRIHHNNGELDIQAECYTSANALYIETYLAFNNKQITVDDFKIEFIKGRPFYNMSYWDWENLTNELGSIAKELEEETE